MNVEGLAWLVGRWENADSSETWTPAQDGQMLGISQTRRPGNSPFFEFLRVEQEGETVVYHASPGGRAPATPFRLTQLTEESAIFENSGHDFPQVIRYDQTREGLRVELTGLDRAGNPKHATWTWDRK